MGRVLVSAASLLLIGWFLSLMPARTANAVPSYADWIASRDEARVASLAALRTGGDVDAVRREAETGDPEAQAALGLLLCDRGDFDEATVWFAAAASQRHVDAMQYMVLLSAPRPGVPADPSTARRWARILESLRGPGYHTVVGLVSGSCVPPAVRDHAAQFVEAAIIGEFPGPLSYLAGYYQRGDGVERDLVEALALILAARRNVSGYYDGQWLVRLQAEIEAQLTPAEIAAARTRAREWMRL